MNGQKWRLVPVEPSDSMRNAIDDAFLHHNGEICAMWKAGVGAAPQPEPLSDGRIKEILLANGFTVKAGLTDLKPYVYQAIRAIEREIITGSSAT